MTRPLRSGRTLVAWLLGAAVAGCGAKAPPLAPLIIAPERIGQVDVSRLDDYVYVEFEVPSSNTTRDGPADVVWVEVYALTTQPAEGEEEEFSEDWLEAATLVETVLVRPPVLPGMEEPAVEEDEGGPAGEGERAPASQGDEVTVVERLGPEEFVPVTVGEEEEEEDEQEDEEVEDEGRPILQPYVAPPFPPPVIRSYVAFGVSSRGREGGASRMESIPLVDPPAPPAAPAVEYTATSIRVTWEAPDTLRLPVQYDGFGPPPGAPAAGRRRPRAGRRRPRRPTPLPRRPTPLPHRPTPLPHRPTPLPHRPRCSLARPSSRRRSSSGVSRRATSSTTSPSSA